MPKSETDSNDNHGIGEALIRVFKGLGIEAHVRPLTSVVPAKVERDMLCHTDDGLISPPLKAKFEKGNQKEYKALP
ncbi:hypothetical protein AMTR_s00076p00146490 [Amborella trichopoda]|uniref:Uncharacterized protein n=1 Tax=Amborella trichopoda TaxID=13333 RepID=W1P497_AMBTC|nr:hypothetical protein AMTR_s00076p00146490 [Amborella trichopoda]